MFLSSLDEPLMSKILDLLFQPKKVIWTNMEPFCARTFSLDLDINNRNPSKKGEVIDRKWSKKKLYMVLLVKN